MVSLLLPVIYLAFISLGLPDSLLGSAWPVMYQELGTSVSAAGIISMIISAGTIVSSLNSDRLNTRFGTGKVTAVSVLTTAVALFGFSISHSFWALCLWGIPYGLGAGSVDAALNNYVALHYKARHMSWLHCMWGIGAAGDMSSMSAYFATVFRLTWSIRAISDLERPAASIDRISFTVSRGTVISSILPGRARQSNRPGKPYGEGRAPGPRSAALLLKLLNFSCSRCLFPSDHSDHFLVNINTPTRSSSRPGAG